MPLAFVSGATGYLGAACVEAFVNAGFTVRAAARSQAKADAWTQRNPQLSRAVSWTIIEAIDAPDALASAFEDVEVVCHCAADLPDAMGDAGAAIDRTSNGVREALKAAKATPSVRKFVLTSCVRYLGVDVLPSGEAFRLAIG